MNPSPLPWTIEPEGNIFVIRDANGRIVAEVIGVQNAVLIVAAVTDAAKKPA